ncbi:uncharacterized protein F4822DRAFT_432405 [Hypoxylon trugodes]|uniref:uncharacterized protein n=1 Tax=Hypoxylon trugodes TaxID=326681 RepID=UPI002198C4A3|nr:uncharacterized protein F4822DRAFT_432405 [Hypoxylon trugodes]KAI1385552.1 hypothetical protein F4822DRAFT_432405 [Hypoxylon trugodes]
MANGTSSVGMNLDSCSSNPHTSTPATSPEDDAKMLSHRLSSATQTAQSNVTDRLLCGGSYDHEGNMKARIDVLTSQIGTTATTTNGTGSS